MFNSIYWKISDAFNIEDRIEYDVICRWPLRHCTQEIIARLFEEAETSLRSMEFELRTYAEDVKSKYQKKCEDFRTDMTQLRQKLKKLILAFLII